LTHIEILRAMAESPTLADMVLSYLNEGMWDEWDCDLASALGEVGLGGPELQIAARSALALANYRRGQ